MKKIFFILLIVMLSVPALAQTNFRDVTYKEAIVIARAEKKQVFIDFYTSWCGPCKMLGPVLEQVAAKVDDVQIVKINVDEESSVAEKYNIMSIPTLLLFKSGECVAKSVGFISEGQVMEFIGK